MENQTQAQCEMPRYKSHKHVWALKIARIEYQAQSLANGEAGKLYHATAMIYPVENGYSPFEVDAAYLWKHNPRVGGYYVVYAGGDKSWSPAQAFEEGYERVA